MPRTRYLFLLVALGVTLAVGPCGCAHVITPIVFDAQPRAFRHGSAPVLLVHGVLLVGSRVQQGLTSFETTTVQALEDDGFDVFLPALPALQPPIDREPVLLRAIDEVLARTGAHHVNLIAHSEAGVDVRLLLDDPRAAGKVASVVTLSTPHAGTPMAVVALALRGSLSESLLNRVARQIDESRGWPSREGRLHDTAEALTPRSMAQFNAEHPTTSVPFFSLAATPELARDGVCDGGAWPAPARRGHRTAVMSIAGGLMDENTPAVDGQHENNDGIVPTRSERFGVFLGCVALDHGGWLHTTRGGVDVLALIRELARGMRDVELHGDAAAMMAHVPAMAAIVGAVR